MYGNGKNEQKNSAALGGGERSCGADLGDVIVGAAEARHDLAAEELPRRPCHAEERARQRRDSVASDWVKCGEEMETSDDKYTANSNKTPGSSVLNGSRSIVTRTSSSINVYFQTKKCQTVVLQHIQLEFNDLCFNIILVACCGLNGQLVPGKSFEGITSLNYRFVGGLEKKSTSHTYGGSSSHSTSSLFDASTCWIRLFTSCRRILCILP